MPIFRQIMIEYHLKLAYRNCIKQRLFTFISVAGLAVGIAASTMLFIYVRYEKSYDRFYPETQDLYRVNYHLEKEGKQLINSCRTQSALSWVLLHESELIAASCRTFYEECYMYTEKVKLYGQQVLWADSAFLEVFQPEMIVGNRRSALAQKYSVVISETVARKYFGEGDPIGQIIKLNEGIPFAVTGVFRDLPRNTHLHYDFIVSFQTLEDYGVNQRGVWKSHFVSTYFRKNPSVTEASLTRLLANLIQKYLVPVCKEGETAGYSIQPVKDIYLDSDQEGEFQQQGNMMKIGLLFVVAIFILAIAWANNINISTALSFERARESGILKLHGASNQSLISYHLAEFFLINLISIILSVILVIAFFPFFRSLIGLEIYLKSVIQPWLGLLYLFFLVGGVFFTGAISAWIQSLVHPSQVLKNMFHDRLKFHVVRRVLAVCQFALAIVLIISTILIVKQIDYLESRDLGMKADQVLVMRGPATNNTSGERRYHEFCAFRDELLQLPGVESLTATMNIPGQANKYNNVAVLKNGQKVNASFNISFADENYFRTYQVPILAGRNFYPSIANEQNSVIINEKASSLLGFNSPQKAVGESITVNNRFMQIVGIARDFHHESLRKTIEPYIYQFKHPHEFGYYPALVSTANVSGLLMNVEAVWKKHYPDAQADFFFLDTFFNKQYQTYTQLSELVGISAFLAVFIACMGLFAFVKNTVNKKVKEIGIRKVNGAKVFEVMSMLNADFVKWVLIAFAIAAPIAWYAMTRWLGNFAYKTDFSWWIFVLAGLLTLGVALLTVSLQSYKAAVKNPVEALRYE
ncbi:MAG: ABC transporter permease [Mangrovibacterium sp.]